MTRLSIEHVRRMVPDYGDRKVLLEFVRTLMKLRVVGVDSEVKDLVYSSMLLGG